MTVQADTTTSIGPVSGGGRVRVAVWLFHLVVPLTGLWLLLARPELDVRWEHRSSHFWLVLGVAAANVALGLRMQSAARDREDARLLLVGFAFTASAGFLFLHAVATPGVALGEASIGFEIATPVGLALAAILLAVSAMEVSSRRAAALVANEKRLRSGLLVIMVGWAVWSLAGFPPLAIAPATVDLATPLRVLAVVSVGIYGLAALGYFRIHRRRPSVMLVALITASALLAEAMITVTFARNWQLSWWLWHLLMTLGFGFFVYSSYVQYRREGSAAGLFNAITSDRTVARIRAEYAGALETLTAALHRSEEMELSRDEIDLIAAGLAARFDLTEGQTAVLGRAAEALASEQDQARRLAALAAIGGETGVTVGEEELLRRIQTITDAAFGRDRLRLGLIRDGRLEFTGVSGEGVQDVEAFPLLINGVEAGTLEASRPGGLADRDRSIYEALAAEISIALENTRLYEQVEALFRQYMSPDVATALLADPAQARLGGSLVEVTALFADLRGFTAFSERSAPEEIVEMLNAYFARAVPEILAEGGTVVQFVGDALLAVFNTPARQADHALQACRAALRMQESIAPIARDNPGWPLFRVGINTGPALAGNIGSDEIRSFNVMGDAVNVAARFESMAEPGTVVIGDTTLRELGELAEVDSLGSLALKGRNEPVEAYRLRGLAGAGARILPPSPNMRE